MDVISGNMQICLYLWLTVIFLQDDSLSFVLQSSHVPRKLQERVFVAPRSLVQNAKRNDDDEGENRGAPGMTDAFQKLDSLVEALGNVDDGITVSMSPPAKSSLTAGESLVIDPKTIEALTPEREIQMYTELMKDLEVTDDETLYSDVIEKMGGMAHAFPPSAFAPPSASNDTSNRQKSFLVNELQSSLPNTDMQNFMEDALNEALKDVKLKPSNFLSSESILNDETIMKEIEAIFDKGSAQLMESLEEIRKEQQSLAEQSAGNVAQEAADAVSNDAVRLANAEAAMATMLQRVNRETAQVEKAVVDLRNAQAELESDAFVKLRNGGIAKQSAFVGFLLFSFRSIADTVVALNNDESLLSGALIQGGIALVCAVIFFLL